ncbi:MAG: universal stress protein [Nitrospirota bacterium]|nr:universal stress protein [Nitrospirota bacterium]
MRVILAPLVGDNDDEVVMHGACALARALHGHVDALFVRPDPTEAMMVVGEGMSPEIIDTITRASTATWDARREVAKSAFDLARAAVDAPLVEQAGASSGVTSRWRELVVGAETVGTDHSRLADLIVFAGIGAEGDSYRRRMFESALFNAARPLLLMPRASRLRAPKVLAFAWNGSMEATRALLGALPLLEAAEAVHVLTAATAKTPAGRGENLAAYLAWHGLAAEIHQLHPSTGEVGAALLDQARKLDADLLIMGGYGHGRVRELIFGGVTQHVLSHLELPVLLAH